MMISENISGHSGAAEDIWKRIWNCRQEWRKSNALKVALQYSLEGRVQKGIGQPLYTV